MQTRSKEKTEGWIILLKLQREIRGFLELKGKENIRQCERVMVRFIILNIPPMGIQQI